jgi:RimJ/RimL family protein N-acetyltransferase
MPTHALLREQPVLTGNQVRLEPLTVAVLEDYLLGLADPEVRRMTGSHTRQNPATVQRWLTTRRDQPDRADWAVVRIADGAFLGEAVLNELDVANASVNYRLWLGPGARGHGYGVEVTRRIVTFALQEVGLHRVGLTVFAFNERALRTYKKCGFRQEGRRRECLSWDGMWHDEILMSVRATDL